MQSSIEVEVVGVNFDETPLRDVVVFLTSLFGDKFNVILAFDAMEHEAVITLTMENTPLRTVLQKIAEKGAVAVDYDVFPGIVTFIPKKTATGQ